MKDWLKWKYKQIRKYLLYKTIKNYWKKLWLSESDDATWEILNHDSLKSNKKIQLHYVPKDDYSDDDIKIQLTHKEFEDLVKFIIRIK